MLPLLFRNQFVAGGEKNAMGKGNVTATLPSSFPAKLLLEQHSRIVGAGSERAVSQDVVKLPKAWPLCRSCRPWPPGVTVVWKAAAEGGGFWTASAEGGHFSSAASTRADRRIMRQACRRRCQGELPDRIAAE